MSGARNKRDFLRVTDLHRDEARRVLDFAGVLKAEHRGDPRARLLELAGRSLAIVLEKPSTRTRVSFEIAAASLGMHSTVLGVQGTQLERGEPVRDVARTLGRYCDVIAFRTSSTARLLEMTHADVPVINALSDEGHPMQALADVFTMREALDRDARGLRVAFLGDGGSNVARSLVEAACLFDFHVVLGAPDTPSLRPPPDEISRAGEHLSMIVDPKRAAIGADVIYTDVWTSMGLESEGPARSAVLGPYRVDESLLRVAASHAIVMHCLPAHRGEEIDEAVLEGPRSRVWDQAENRLHVQKAMLLFLLASSRPPPARQPAAIEGSQRGGGS